eukprot:6358127-Prymnesium_polylepis.1
MASCICATSSARSRFAASRTASACACAACACRTAASSLSRRLRSSLTACRGGRRKQTHAAQVQSAAAGGAEEEAGQTHMMQEGGQTHAPFQIAGGSDGAGARGSLPATQRVGGACT